VHRFQEQWGGGDGEPASLSHALPPTGPAVPALSFERLYELHFSFTWRVLEHLGVPRHGLDDAVQEVWLAVHRRLPTFEGRSQVETWLFGIALNVTRNLRRADSRHSRLVPEPADLPANTPDPEALRARSEAYHQVQRFLDTLDAQQRAIFVCNLIEHLSAAETAEATGVEVNTVYQSVRNLRRWFKSWLGEQEVRSP
jgi:RNA polymerase sigma-70 factor, ECF subfamily